MFLSRKWFVCEQSMQTEFVGSLALQVPSCLLGFPVAYIRDSGMTAPDGRWPVVLKGQITGF